MGHLGLLAGLFREPDGAEETIGIVTRAGGEEELIGRSVGSSTLAELNGPELVYLDRLATGVAKRPQELTRLWIEGVYPASGGVAADEDRVAHRAEVSGGLRDAPW
jgi:hypothetical protein